MRETANLSCRENRYEETRNGVSSGVGDKRSKNRQRNHGVKGTRLDEHGDDGLGQSTNSSHPQSSASVPGVHDQPENDHEGEEDVE